MPNTLLAHALIYAAPEADRYRLLDALHTAYFEDGRDIGDQETLLTIAAEIGLDRRALAAALNFPDFRSMIAAQVNEISRSGITGVPFFIFNDAVGLSGAQPPEIILQAMRKAEETVTVGGDA
jgi:predicted DsbA family dithiol-disulfide isomerase